MDTKQKSSKGLRAAIAAIVVVVLLAIGALAYANYGTDSTTSTSPSTATDSVQTEQAAEPAEQANYISYVAVKGQTALAQLKDVNDSVVTEKSTYGEYVASINQLKGGTEGKYWSFYINEKLADVGAGSYTAEGGEKIEWKFQKLD